MLLATVYASDLQSGRTRFRATVCRTQVSTTSHWYLLRITDELVLQAVFHQSIVDNDIQTCKQPRAYDHRPVVAAIVRIRRFCGGPTFDNTGHTICIRRSSGMGSPRIRIPFNISVHAMRNGCSVASPVLYRASHRKPTVLRRAHDIVVY